MSNTDMPNNAAEWASFLTEKKLPSPFRVGRLALQTIERKTPSYAQLAEQLTSDPVLSFYIMEEAGQQESNESSSSKTLDHAISMIGIESLKDIIRRLPHEKFDAEQVQSLYYVKTLVRSLYAAHLAKRIAQERNQHNADDLYWAGLFVYTPLWYLWRFATPELRILRYAVNTNHKAKIQAQREILNCSVEEISEALVSELALPPMVKACYQPENQPSAKQWVQISQHQKSTGKLLNVLEDKTLKFRIQNPAFVVQLAKLISDNSMNDWYSRATYRTQKILAAYLDITQAESIQLTHNVAASMSRAHPLPGLLLPAARLFLPPQPLRLAKTDADKTDKAQSSPAEAPPAAKPKKSAPAKSAAPKPIYTELVTAMYKTPSDFNDLHELMNAATSALVFGLGLSRATISLINKERTRIKTYYSTGCEEHKELANFDARLVKDTLFSKLCTKPACVWLKTGGDEKINSLVPMNFKQIIDIEDYFLMSVFVNEKPFAIVYCDAYPDKAMNESDYKYFKYLCKGLSNALNYLVRKNRES